MGYSPSTPTVIIIIIFLFFAPGVEGPRAKNQNLKTKYPRWLAVRMLIGTKSRQNEHRVAVSYQNWQPLEQEGGFAWILGWGTQATTDLAQEVNTRPIQRAEILKGDRLE